MPERRTVVLNSLLTLILVATIYQFIKSEILGREVSSVDRSMQRTQQQIADLREAASSTFEQTMRRFDDFGRQLSASTAVSKSAGTSNTATEKHDVARRREWPRRTGRLHAHPGGI